jgi:pimeloyl-ACP methyl ester carboxylesterase
MKRLIRRITPVALLLTCLYLTGYSQQRGNIVEYFGRERVEQIEEGTVFHVFTEGLTMPLGPGSTGVIPSRDIIAWHFSNGTFRTPRQGEFLHPVIQPEDSIYIWEKLNANEENLFQSRNMRRAYLYTSLQSPKEEIVLLDAKGHTRLYINGLPYEGDHYDFGYTLIPFKLKKGLNEFIYTPGRFGRVSAKLVAPEKPVQLTPRDMTLPSLINGEKDEKWGAVRVINATEKDVRDLVINCQLESGEDASVATGQVMALSVRKLPFRIPSTSVKSAEGKVKAVIILKGKDGKEIDRTEITLNQHEPDVHHERTFISQIDGSVQYYSIAPSTVKAPGQALVLSVHGAGVEARNQARAYKQKDWAHVVAATNRRPYGFNWEEWGRKDGMEVLAEAKQVFQTLPKHTYLTGHSMGGHGTWHLGVTYPDQFAAIAPCASYPDILGYGRGPADPRFAENQHFKMLMRSANGGRTLDLKRNFLQSGVYILHGDDDTVVPVTQARNMREALGAFHNNFVYYEYPGGSHWYGDHSVDWHPIFTYFKWQSIPEKNEVKHIEFHTASPGISATNYWITLNQQEIPLQFSSVTFDRSGDTITGITNNTAALMIEISSLKFAGNPVLMIDGQTLQLNAHTNAFLKKNSGKWSLSTVNPAEKKPSRSGGFKDAFDNRVVLVYATNGSREENDWYRNKARFDAEAFQYKANGSIEVISDREFNLEDYADRNVIIYGNSVNNRAWGLLLAGSPVIVRSNEIIFGDKIWKGDDIGAYFIQPRPDSETASVGVVAGTGVKGMKATSPNDYFSGVNGYPDLLIFKNGWLNEGLEHVLVSGFFNNDWSIGENFTF